MAVKVYIDGQEGTTGLRIIERFSGRNDIELLRIDEDKRKDTAERKRLINSSDYTFLCLPDAAAIESAKLCTNRDTVIIDGGDVKVVAVRMRLAGEHLGHQELVVNFTRFFRAFHFQTNGSQCLCHFFRRYRKIHMTSQPIQRNFHLYSLCGSAFQPIFDWITAKILKIRPEYRKVPRSRLVQIFS